MTIMNAPELEHVCDFTVDLSRPIDVGAVSAGQRRIIPIVGGQAQGPKINGAIQNLGADWATVHEEGVTKLDARYLIETPEGAQIEVVSQGMRHGPEDVMARVAQGEPVDPTEYYMRTFVRLESGHPDYAWVNSALFLAAGGRFSNQVILSIYQIG